jgi:hypothetical protein
VRSGHKFLVALLALQAAAALAADDVAVDVERKGRSFAVRFIPGLSHSAVQLRGANRVQLQQKGEARFLFFAYPIDVRLEVVESPRDSITSRAVGGNLRRMNGRYELHRAAGGVRLNYAGELEPDFALPPLIGTLAVRSMVRRASARGRRGGTRRLCPSGLHALRRKRAAAARVHHLVSGTSGARRGRFPCGPARRRHVARDARTRRRAASL